MTTLIISGLIWGWIFINRRLSIKFELILRISNLRIIWVISKSKLSLISRQSWQILVHFPNLTKEASCDAIASGRSPNPHAPVLHELRNSALLNSMSLYLEENLKLTEKFNSFKSVRHRIYPCRQSQKSLFHYLEDVVRWDCQINSILYIMQNPSQDQRDKNKLKRVKNCAKPNLDLYFFCL